MIRRPKAVDAAAEDRSELLRQIEHLRSEHGPLLERSMLDIPVDKNNDSGKTQLRLMQFNILAQGLSSAPQFGGFVKTPRESLDWDGFRKFRVLDEVLRFEPDVVAMEEVDHFDDFFLPAMKHFGYDGLFQPKFSAPTLSQRK